MYDCLSWFRMGKVRKKDSFLQIEESFFVELGMFCHICTKSLEEWHFLHKDFIIFTSLIIDNKYKQ